MISLRQKALGRMASFVGAEARFRRGKMPRKLVTGKRKSRPAKLRGASSPFAGLFRTDRNGYYRDAGLFHNSLRNTAQAEMPLFPVFSHNHHVDFFLL